MRDDTISLDEARLRRHVGMGPRMADTGAKGLRCVNPADWQDKAIPERPWLVPGLLPLGSVTMLSGDGGLGKSLLALQLATCGAVGAPFIGYDVGRFKSLAVCCEDEADELQRRMAEILAGLGQSFSAVEGMELVPRVGMDSVLMNFSRTGEAEETAFFVQIMNRAIENDVRLIVLDSLHDLYAGNENDRVQARRFISGLRTIATEANAAVLLLAHPSLSGLNSGSGSSGSTAWNNSVRSRLYLSKPEENSGSDDGSRVLATKKSNYARAGDDLLIMFSDGRFVRDMGPGSGVFGSMRKDAARQAFMRCLRKLRAQGRRVTDAFNSPHYAPKVMAKMSEGKGFKPRELTDAMEELFSCGSIILGEERGPDRKPVKSIIEAPAVGAAGSAGSAGSGSLSH